MIETAGFSVIQRGRRYRQRRRKEEYMKPSHIHWAWPCRTLHLHRCHRWGLSTTASPLAFSGLPDPQMESGMIPSQTGVRSLLAGGHSDSASSAGFSHIFKELFHLSHNTCCQGAADDWSPAGSVGYHVTVSTDSRFIWQNQRLPFSVEFERMQDRWSPLTQIPQV